MRRRSVVFPQPDKPMMATTLPGNNQVDVLQNLALIIAERDVSDFDQMLIATASCPE